jgi:hypothetical protein
MFWFCLYSTAYIDWLIAAIISAKPFNELFMPLYYALCIAL